MGTIRNAPSENAPSDPDTAPWSLWRRSSSSRRSRWSCSTSPSSTSPCPHSSAIWGSPPDLHLLLVPVSPSSSQRYQRRDMSGSPSNCRARPLTVGWIMRLSGNRPGSPLRRSGTRPSNRRSRGCRSRCGNRPPPKQFEVALVRARVPFAYQAIAARAVFLARLGMTASAIARCIGASPTRRGRRQSAGIASELTGSRQALPRSDGQALGGGRLAQAIVEAGEARRRARELLHFECTGQMDGIKAPQGAALRELSGPPRHFRG